MHAYITKITEEYGRNGRQYHICFRGTNPDKSYDAYVICSFRNYQQWRGIIGQFLKGAQVWLDGLTTTKDRAGRDIVNADSPFFIYRVIYPSKENISCQTK